MPDCEDNTKKECKISYVFKLVTCWNNTLNIMSLKKKKKREAWPKSSFGLSVHCYGKAWTNFRPTQHY